jgi:hypothetical protein
MEQSYTTLSQLQKQHSGGYIPYDELLGTLEWKTKRDLIIKRDKGRCTKCGTLPTQKHFANGKTQHIIDLTKDLDFHQIIYESPILLQVHHLYYITSKIPWEYQDKALVTLCDSCHKRIHDECSVPVYKFQNNELIDLHAVACSRCAGSGYLSEYMHYKGGICFECKGERYLSMIFKHE